VVNLENARARTELLQQTIRQLKNLTVDDVEFSAARILVELRRQIGAGHERHDDL
jgi:hypothetical protein